MAMSSTAGILALPPELLLDHLLVDLPLHDLLALGATCRYFRSLTLDAQLWLRKTRRDFAYAPATAAPAATTAAAWFKRVYLGLLRPRTFVWGSSDNARLGTLAQQPYPAVVRHTRGVDRPVEVTRQFGRGRTWAQALRDEVRARAAQVSRRADAGLAGEAGIVELQAGGWSFTARDTTGQVWVWGQLDGTVIRFRAPTWEDKHCQCPDPTRIPLPCRALSISAGRRHLLVLDADNIVWELCAWGRAFHHTAPALTSPLHPGAGGTTPHIAQLSAGWEHSAALTAAGAIHVWFPFGAAYAAACTPEDQLHGPLGADEDDLSRVLRWGTVGPASLHALDSVPRRPAPAGGDSDESVAEQDAWRAARRGSDEAEERVVKIASGLGWLVALKACGEVWAVQVAPDGIGAWEYLRHFSSPHVTHISAQYETVASYTPDAAQSIRVARLRSVARGTGDSLRPAPLPGLDGERVIQFVAGDYHEAALTADGDMYTWGQNGAGQLGLGHAGVGLGRGVERPTKVVFGSSDVVGASAGAGTDADTGTPSSRPDAFVFGITAAGWHTGALVLGDPSRGPDDEAGAVLGGDDLAGQNERDLQRQFEAELARQRDGGAGIAPVQMPMPGAFPQPAAGAGAGAAPALGRGGGVHAMPFRVGFAGRGAMPNRGALGRGGVTPAGHVSMAELIRRRRGGHDNGAGGDAGSNMGAGSGGGPI